MANEPRWFAPLLGVICVLLVVFRFDVKILTESYAFSHLAVWLGDSVIFAASILFALIVDAWRLSVNTP